MTFGKLLPSRVSSLGSPLSFFFFFSVPFQQLVFGDWLCLWEFRITEDLLRYLGYYALCMTVLGILAAPFEGSS